MPISALLSQIHFFFRAYFSHSFKAFSFAGDIGISFCHGGLVLESNFIICSALLKEGSWPYFRVSNTLMYRRMYGGTASGLGDGFIDFCSSNWSISFSL